MKRNLTKSLFIVGHGCPAKLFYTQKDCYPNTRDADDFLKELAEGGVVVGELAKHYFPDGKEVETTDVEALQETQQLMLQENVVIFEAAVAFQNLMCRIDILVKQGSELQLIEVKAKSIDGNESDPFLTKGGAVRSEWKNYLLDVAFQRLVLRDAFPEFSVHCSLMCVDKTKECTVDGLFQILKVTRDDETTSFKSICNETENLICREILTKQEIDKEVDQCVEELSMVESGGRDFSQYVRYLADNYQQDIKITPEIGGHCRDCEFRSTFQQREEGKLDGFRECWSEKLNWSDADFTCPTVFDLYDFRKADDFIRRKIIKLKDFSKEDQSELGNKIDSEPGLTPQQMQRVRFDFLGAGDGKAFVDIEGLQHVKENWKYPLHFIDFETATPPVPLHRGLKPYESLAFQFSHHMLDADGSTSHAGEFLSCEPGVFPNFDFLRQLKSSLSNDEGTIFRYATHENTILNHIITQLDKFGRNEKDYDVLREFACSISQPTKLQPNPWLRGEREMIDLRKLVARHYYHPRMKGSQSIKYVLPAVLTDSEFLREKYSKPNYGYEIESKSSRNFSVQTWIQFDEANGEIIDPYELLSPVFDEFDKQAWDKMWSGENIRGGGAAMAAYLWLQQSGVQDGVREKVKNGLLRYCELDTLAMMMIVESWLNHST